MKKAKLGQKIAHNPFQLDLFYMFGKIIAEHSVSIIDDGTATAAC